MLFFVVIAVETSNRTHNLPVFSNPLTLLETLSLDFTTRIGKSLKQPPEDGKVLITNTSLSFFYITQLYLVQWRHRQHKRYPTVQKYLWFSYRRVEWQSSDMNSDLSKGYAKTLPCSFIADMYQKECLIWPATKYIYHCQNKGWMDCEVLSKWIRHVFPIVKPMLQDRNVSLSDGPSIHTKFLVAWLPAQIALYCKIWGCHGGDCRISFFRMWFSVARVRTDVSEENFASIINVERISELEKLVITSNWNTCEGILTVFL
jgi:hypothetical protein